MNAIDNPQGDNLTIMVLDDEVTIRNLVAKELEKAGYTVVSFPNKSDGLQWIQKSHVDLVISDINSPRMDGFTFIKLLRANPNTNMIPCIIVTGLAEFKFAIDALSLGVSDYLTKPFEIDELMQAVHRALGQI